MRGAFWFTAGAAAATYVMMRGRRLYREYLPEAMRKEIERRSGDAAADFGDFTATFRHHMAEREAELIREHYLRENEE